MQGRGHTPKSVRRGDTGSTIISSQILRLHYELPYVTRPYASHKMTLHVFTLDNMLRSSIMLALNITVIGHSRIGFLGDASQAGWRKAIKKDLMARGKEDNLKS